MIYRGYEVIEEKNSIIVGNLKDFNAVHIFECGQCFRWIKQPDGSYTGIVGDKIVNAKFKDNNLFISNSTLQDFEKLWFDYFDLGRDYSEIKSRLGNDEIMRKAIQFGYGIRILKQDIWETLVSFIISANNRIPRIMKTVALISKLYGTELHYNNEKYHAFPDFETLSRSNLEELQVCKGGFRCKYILQTSQRIKNGEVRLGQLDTMSTDSARNELMKLPGIGPKVADCVLLYSGTKHDVFPTDVWVKRVMEELYFKREASFKEIQEFAKEYFGELLGFAQQYLFYYARENRIGTK